MERIWLRHYPEGIPATVNIDEHASLRDIFEHTCARHAEGIAFRNLGGTLSYAELEAATRDFAAWLQHDLGLRKGERLALMMPNLLQYPVAMFGALRAGLTVVNCNPLYTARELEHQLVDSGATAIVVLENFAHTLQEVLPRTPVRFVVTTQVGDLLPALKGLITNLAVKHLKHMVPDWHIDGAIPFKTALEAGRRHALTPVALGHDDVAFLQYTGGTTGVAMQHAVAKKWEAVTGAPLIEGYGLTETSPIVTGNPLDIKEWTGTIGLPVPSTDVSIRDDAGNELPIGQVGEICVRGPQVMRGYWNRPQETEQAFIDGWLRTGDMGYMDERGYVRITDRKKDMILVSGFNVYPNEVEDIVMTHPGVLEVAAIGAPDEHSGEVVRIVVVKKDPALTAEELLAHCRRHLTGYKMPKIVEFRSEPLPKTNIGKVLRRLLRDEYAGKAG